MLNISEISRGQEIQNFDWSIRSFIKRHTRGTSSHNECYYELQRMARSDNKWYSECYNEWQRVTTNNN